MKNRKKQNRQHNRIRYRYLWHLCLLLLLFSRSLGGWKIHKEMRSRHGAGRMVAESLADRAHANAGRRHVAGAAGGRRPVSR